MTLKNKAVTGMGWTLLQQFGYQGINFLVQLVLARILAPEAFGIIALLQVFMAVGTNLIDSGMASSLIRNKDVNEEDYSTVFYLNILVAFAIYLTVYLLSPFIANFYSIPILEAVIKVYCISFVVNAFSIVQVTKLTKEMKFKKQMLIQLPSLIIAGSVSIYVAYNGWGVWSIVVYNLLQNVLQSLQYWFGSKWRPKRVFNVEKLKYHFSFGYKLTIASLLNSIYDNIYALVIGKNFSPQILGYYNRAELFQLFPGKNISTALEKVTYPMFSQLQENNDQLRRYYREIFNCVVYFLTPTMIILATLAEPFFRFLLTEKWLPMVPYFQVLTIVGVLHPFQRYNLNILRVKGRSDLVLKLNVIKKIILTVLIVISINYGMYGILLSQCLFAVISVYLNTMYSANMIGYSLFDQIKDVWGIYFLGVLTAIFVFVIDKYIFFGYSDIMRVILGVFSGYLFYFFVSYVCKFRTVKTVFSYMKIKKYGNGK